LIRDLGQESDQVEKKTGEGKTWCDPADSVGWPGDPVRPSCNPLTFVFLLKQYCFDLKKINLDDPVTRSKPETPAESKNYDHHSL
jgi:hypothetical protein